LIDLLYQIHSPTLVLCLIRVRFHHLSRIPRLSLLRPLSGRERKEILRIERNLSRDLCVSIVRTNHPIKREGSRARKVTQVLQPKKGLVQAAFHIPWPIVATVIMLIGATRLAGQESIQFQDGNNAIDAVVLRVMNAERTARGLGAVSANKVLQTAAQWMAEDMAARHTLDHTDSRHRGLASRLQDFGYENPRLIAENISEGQETPTAVVNSWMHSPPHRANLLHPEARHAGVGHALSAQGQHYWVLELGTTFTNP
jgi:uncharacterized protein YkwD